MPGASAVGSIYVPYRALGLVCDGSGKGGAAPAVHRRGTASFITSPVDGGRAVHLYDTGLKLKGVSPQLPEGIVASVLAAVDDYTFVAGADTSDVFVFRNMRNAAVWQTGSGTVTSMLVVANFLVAVIASERRVLAWRIPTSRKATTPKEGDIVADIQLPKDFSPTAVTHPPTYLNKLLIGSDDGRLLLLNLRSQKVVHEFPGFSSRVNVLTPSPVLDVVAVGTGDGRIILHNIRVDETVLTLRHTEGISDDLEEMDIGSGNDDSDGGEGASLSKPSTASSSLAVTVLSFCTDGSETLVSGDAVGNLGVWSLNEKTLLAIARGVHSGGTATAHFLPGEPLLVTAGVTDNTIKVHVFDGPTRTARVLRSREGHRLPPTRVRFSGRDSKMLVSAGLDRELRVVSVVRDAQNRSFSQAGLGKASARVKKRRRANAGVEDGAQRQLTDGARRLPVITGIATCSARKRDKDFANVVTIHARRGEAYTWRLESGAVYRHVLRPPPPREPLKLAFQRARPSPGQGSDAKGQVPRDSTSAAQLKRGAVSAKSVAISYCGNFAFVGLSNGEVHSFNVQSGRHQGTYVADKAFREALTKPTRKLNSWGCAHSGSVTGLAVDATGDVLVSADSHGVLRFWNMTTREPIEDPVALPSGVSSLVWSKSSDLIAVVCNDFGVYVYDSSTRKLARRLVGHAGAVTDACFDGEGRRLVTSSMDGTVKTWDLPSGRAVDTLQCETAPTSIAVAPGGEFIATSHVDSLCIALWVDRSKFDGAVSRIVPRKYPSNGGSGDGDQVELPGATTHAMYDAWINGGHVSPVQHEFVENGGNCDEDSGENCGDGGSKRPAGDSVEALASGLVTLSGRPTTQWTTLANLDAIKRRNKPLQPPKKPEAVPFFLPTVKALKPAFDLQASENALEDGRFDGNGVTSAGLSSDQVPDKSGAGKSEDDFFGNSEFGSLVAAGNLTAASKLLASKGPSGVDVEIRTLEGPSSRLGACQYFLWKLGFMTGFEITQAHLDLFLKAHGVDLADDEGGSELIRSISKTQKELWEGLRNSFDSVLTLSAHFAGHV